MNRFYGSDFLEQMLADLGSETKPIIRSIRTLDELQQVYRLTHECYVSNEYADPHPSGMLIHYPQFDHIPETSILVAIVDGKIVGSVSLTVDSQSGLTIDDDFKETCDAIRAEEDSIAVVWRLVVEKSERSNRAIVTHLINAVIELMHEKNVKTGLFSVNPKHENVYKRMLNMQVIARNDITEGLKNAPAVLLRGDPFKIPKAETPTEHRAPLFHLLANSPY